MRRKAFPIAIISALVAFTMPVDPGSAGHQSVATLAVGESAFWDGPFIESSTFAHPELCTIDPSACIEYRLDVAAGGGRLRIAIDHPAKDAFGLEVFDPSRARVASTGDVARESFQYVSIWYSTELFAQDPAAGTWTVRVAPYHVSDSGFRMRAMLETAAPDPPIVPAPLLPNLQTIAPFDVKFNPAFESSCHPVEESRYGATRCLRYAYGPQNVGDGILHLAYPSIEGVIEEGQAMQRIHYTDGSTTDRPAGTFVYHPEHAHYHHTAIGAGTLYRVLDASAGTLEEAGESPKVGYCMGDYLIAEWDEFRADPVGDLSDALTGCVAVAPGAGAHIRLTAGWGDIYTAGTEANFVPFDDNPDGLYVIRVDADSGDSLLETNEVDNFAYAYVEVTGNDVTLLERGRGLDPWDPAKVVVDDTRR